MKTLIREVTVIAMQENDEIIRDADVLVDGQLISYVGPRKLWEDSFDRVINGRGKLLLPGFVNAHGHAAMTLFRSFADDVPLMDWLEKSIWPVETKLKREDVYWGTMLAILEMIKCGTTTFTDMYFFMDQVAEAAEEEGIRAVLARGLIGIGQTAEKGLEESQQFVKTWQERGNSRITTMLGPHAPYTCPPDFLQRVMVLQETLDVPIQIHLAETRGEVERITKEYGVSPTVLLKNIGLLDKPVLAAHCVHLNSEEMDILKEHNVHVAHNPGSNLKLGSGIAPLPELLRRGITVGLGTDGAASNNNLDMMEEMRLAALIHKGNCLDPTVITAREALAMATRESAKAVFLEKVGVVAPGMKADIIMLDLQRPHLTPQHDLVAHLVYAAQPADITMVLVNGQILLENGQLTTLDEEKIIFQGQQRAMFLVQQA